MDNGNGNKPVATIPSVLETTMVRTPALYAPSPAPMPPIAAQAAQAPSAPPGLASAPTMGALLHALRRRWLSAAMLAVIGAFLTAAAVFAVMPPKYIPEARLLVNSRESISIGADHREGTEFVIFKANLPSLLKAPLNLSSALNKNVAPTKLARDLSIVRELGGGAIDWLDRAIKTDYNLGPEILRVTLSAERGDEAAELLNAIVDSFLYDLVQKEKARTDEQVEEFQKKKHELDQELSRNRGQLVIREKALKLPNVAELTKKLEIATMRLLAYEKDLMKTKADKIQSQEELRNLGDRQKNIGEVPVPTDEFNSYLRNDPQSQFTYLDFAKADKDYQDALRVSGPKAAEPYKEKRDRYKKQLDELADQLRPDFEKAWHAKFRQELKTAELALADRIKGLDKQFDFHNDSVKKAQEEVDRLMPSIHNVPPEILSLRDNIGSSEKAIDKINQDINLIRANPPKIRVSLLQRASEPQEKDMSRQLKLAGAGGFGVFGLILLAVAFLEFRTRKVGGADDVVRGLGMTVIGTVPPMPEAARKPLPGGASQYDAYWQSRLMESIDGIRTMLLHTSRTDALRVIMVTSAVGGEGKTSLASQLAASLARAWKRTLLIDGDLRNPAAHKLFNVTQEPGFSEVLRGEADPAQAIRATPISRLWVLPAGNWDAHAVQALAQDQVRTMFQNLKQQYDFIIVDSCPVLPVADSLLLAQHTDGVLFSVMRDVSRLPAVWAAQQRLQNLGVRSIGAVVIGDQGDDLGAAAYKYALAYAGK